MYVCSLSQIVSTTHGNVGHVIPTLVVEHFLVRPAPNPQLTTPCYLLLYHIA